MKKVFYSFLVFILFSCSAQKRITRLIENHPNIEIDTLTHVDTIYTPHITIDSSYIISTDTVVIERDRLRIKTVVRNDSIFIQGEVVSDTIIKEVKIPYEVVKFVELNWWQKNRSWIIPLLIAIIGASLLKKFGIL